MRPDRRAIGAAAAGICTFINLYAPQALLPLLAQDFHVPEPQTGWTITAPLLAVALVAPFAGSLSDRLGRRRMIVWAAFALVIPTLLIATAPGLHAMLVWRFVQGLLLPCIFAVTVAYIGEECPGAEGIRLISIYTVGTIFAGFLGRFLSGILASVANWRVAFVVLAALTLLSAIAVALTLPAERRFQPVRNLRGTLDGFARNLTDLPLAAAFVVGFGVLFSIVAAFTYANFYLAAPPFGLGPAALGAVFVVYLLGMVVTPIASALAVRLGRRRAVMACVPAAWVGLALTLVPVLPCIVAGLAVLASCIFVEQALSIGYVGAMARQAKSTAVGLYVTCYYIGGSLGGILPAGIWQSAGWTGCVALVALVQLCILPVVALLWRERAA